MNYLLTKHNIDDVFRNFTENDSLTICKDFPEKYTPSIIRLLSFSEKPINIEYQYSKEKTPYKKYKSYSKIHKFKCPKILHYIGTKKPSKYGQYRRENFNKFLKKNYKLVDTVFANTKTRSYIRMLDRKYNIIFTSRNTSGFILSLKAKADNCKLIYDRSDYYEIKSENDKILGEYLQRNANKIVTFEKLSKTLVSDIDKNKIIFTTNGTNVKPIKPVKKFKKDTAIICGIPWEIDIDALENIILKNQDYNFIYYSLHKKTSPSVNEINRLSKKYLNFKVYESVNEKKLFKIARRCKIGLVLNKKDDFNIHRYPLKFLLYSNALIPTAFTNCLELERYDKYPSALFAKKIDTTSFHKMKKLRSIYKEYCDKIYDCGFPKNIGAIRMILSNIINWDRIFKIVIDRI